MNPKFNPVSHDANEVSYPCSPLLHVCWLLVFKKVASETSTQPAYALHPFGRVLVNDDNHIESVLAPMLVLVLSEQNARYLLTYLMPVGLAASTMNWMESIKNELKYPATINNLSLFRQKYGSPKLNSRG